MNVALSFAALVGSPVGFSDQLGRPLPPYRTFARSPSMGPCTPSSSAGTGDLPETPRTPPTSPWGAAIGPITPRHATTSPGARSSINHGAPMARRRRRPPGGFDPLPMVRQPHDPLLTTGATAELLGRSPRTLEDWRRKGWGPEALRIGSRLTMYRTSAVEAWLARHIG
jgi:predicted DNA-binding transcriptional regulator AlpA